VRFEASSTRHSPLTTALRLLAYRARSEKELRDALARRGVAEDVREETLARLRGLSLIDDEAFARSWVDSRDRTAPRGRAMIASELSAKGVRRETVERCVSAVDEAQAAYRAGVRRARSLASAPYPEFRRRVGDLLLRRGFEHELARSVVQRLWQETHAGRPPEEES
jgi:regulatory protein